MAGELRRVKSELRAVSILMSWERWLGLKNLAATGNIAFTFSSGVVFTVNDDFLNTARNVAVVGRRVKALVTAGTIYGSISASSFSSPTTTVTCVWDSGALDSGLTEVQFGPELRAVGGIQNTRVSPTAPVVGQVWKHDGTLMSPAYEEGVKLLTNKTGVSLVAGDVVALDASNNSAVALADTASTQKQLVVSLDAPTNNATGRFQSWGIVSVLNVTGTITRGNYLVKSATTKVAEDSGVAMGNTTAPPTGAFAVALTPDSAGAVVARLLGWTVSAPTITAKTALCGSLDNAGVASGTTRYFFFGAATLDATEARVQTPMPFAGTLKNFFLRSGTSIGGTGSIVYTVRVNGVDTALTVSIAAGSASTTASDVTHTVAIVAGDFVSISGVYAGGTGSHGVAGFSLELDAA